MHMDFGLLTLAYCPLLLSPSFLCSIVSIAVPYNPVNCPTVISLPQLALLSSFGRETSLVKITGPRSIFTSLFTPSIYFQSLLSFELLSLALILCKKKAGGIDNSSVLIRSKVTCCVCRSRSISGAVDTYLSFLESYWLILNLSIFAKGNLPLHCISPSTWGNQQGTRSLSLVQLQDFWGLYPF